MGAGSNNIVADGLVCCWDGGNRRCGTPSAGGSWTGLGVNAPATLVNQAEFADISLGAILLDGTDDKVTVANTTDIDGAGGFTFDIWLYFLGMSSSKYTVFSLHNSGGGTGEEFAFWIMDLTEHGYTARCGKRKTTAGGASANRRSNDPALQPSANVGKWANWCFTYSGGDAAVYSSYKIYYNGEEKDDGTMGGPGNDGSANANRWGLDSNDYGDFDGYIGRVALYNKELTAAEILQNHEATKPRFKPRIAKSGLVGYWDAGDPQSYNGGTTWKDTANKNNATLENNGTNLNFNSANGGYFEFDGTDDNANLGSITSSNPLMCAGGPVSMCVWMYENSGAGSSNHPYIISKGAGDGTSGYSLMADFQGAIQVAANGQWCQTATGIYSDDEWIYVVGTVDTDGNMRAYVNGVYYANSSHSETGTPPSTTANMRIGARSDGASYCGVSIAQVAIYNALLSDAEIKDFYNKTKGRFGH